MQRETIHKKQEFKKKKEASDIYISSDITAWEKVLIKLLQPRGRAKVVQCHCHAYMHNISEEIKQDCKFAVNMNCDKYNPLTAKKKY